MSGYNHISKPKSGMSKPENDMSKPEGNDTRYNLLPVINNNTLKKKRA